MGRFRCLECRSQNTAWIFLTTKGSNKNTVDLAKAERFLSRFSIKDRDSHAQVPFILNYNQKKIHAVAAKQQDEGQPIRIIVDKARRVGVSSWAEGLGFAHCCAIPG